MDHLQRLSFDLSMTTTTTHETTLVLGANGKTGSRVAQRLAALGQPVRRGSRTSEPSFDWSDPASWAPALDGVDAVYLSYQPDLAFPGAAEQVAAFVTAAKSAGVGRIVGLSGRGEPGAEAAEHAIQHGGTDWAIVRSAFFFQNFSEAFFVEPVRDGVLAFVGGDVTEPFVDAEDVADVAVAALTEDRLLGRVLEVTGPRLMSFADAIAEIGAAAGRDIAFVPISGEELARGLAADGLPDAEVRAYVELFTTVLDGRNSHVTEGVRLAVGREPREFSDFVHATAASGVWDSPMPSAVGGSR